MEAIPSRASVGSMAAIYWLFGGGSSLQTRLQAPKDEMKGERMEEEVKKDRSEIFVALMTM
jgi:hypothetical protein